MTRCRNIGCNDQKDGHCIGIPCGGADTPPPDQSDTDPVDMLRRHLADAHRELAAMTAERDALQLLVLAFKQKREVDGMCGRVWDSTEHLFHEREVARLLGEPEWKWKAGL